MPYARSCGSKRRGLNKVQAGIVRVLVLGHCKDEVYCHHSQDMYKTTGPRRPLTKFTITSNYLCTPVSLCASLRPVQSVQLEQLSPSVFPSIACFMHRMRHLLYAVVAIYAIATVFTVVTSGTVVAAAAIITVGAISTPRAVYILVSRCSKSVKSSKSGECTNAKVA